MAKKITLLLVAAVAGLCGGMLGARLATRPPPSQSARVSAAEPAADLLRRSGELPPDSVARAIDPRVGVVVVRSLLTVFFQRLAGAAELTGANDG